MHQINDPDTTGGLAITRAALAASPGAIPKALVTIDCRCGAHDMTEMAWFAHKFGPATTIGGLLSRYRCRWCGGVDVTFNIAIGGDAVDQSPASTNIIPFPLPPTRR